jgi:hypothetical protein
LTDLVADDTIAWAFVEFKFEHSTGDAIKTMHGHKIHNEDGTLTVLKVFQKDSKLSSSRRQALTASKLRGTFGRDREAMTPHTPTKTTGRGSAGHIFNSQPMGQIGRSITQPSVQQPVSAAQVVPAAAVTTQAVVQGPVATPQVAVPLHIAAHQQVALQGPMANPLAAGYHVGAISQMAAPHMATMPGAVHQVIVAEHGVAPGYYFQPGRGLILAVHPSVYYGSTDPAVSAFATPYGHGHGHGHPLPIPGLGSKLSSPSL